MDFVDGLIIFEDVIYFICVGDFEVNKEGYFVNVVGYFLKGYLFDLIIFNFIGDVL